MRVGHHAPNAILQESVIRYDIWSAAGVVNYDVDGFCERNKDVFNVDLLELMKSSQSSFIQKLFPEQIDRTTKKRPQTSGAKIKQQEIIH